MKMNVLLLLSAGFALAASCAEDFRPSFDKSDYKGRVGIQLNPWFPLNKPPIHALGGPNRAYVHHEGTDIWRQGMELCAEYGVNLWVPEINEPTAWTGVWRQLLDAAGTNNPPIKVGMFFGMYSGGKDVKETKEAVVASMKKVLGPFRDDLKTHPAMNRAGGYPVMIVYNPKKFSPADWGDVFAALDAEFGRMVYLLNVGELAYMAAQGGGGESAVDERFEKLLREYLPYWDGISSYGNGMRVPFDRIRKVMGEYPQKLYEGQGHFTYTCHFHMGGCEVPLSKGWRDHLEDCFGSDPDAVMLTNLFDHYENSIVYPCYDREDLLLRYLEWRLSQWKGREFRRERKPELVVCNYAMVLLGWQSLDFEVLSFPIDAKAGDVTLRLDICDTSGKVLHTFPERKVRSDRFCVERFSVPSTDFAGERGVVPRLRYVWKGRERSMNYNPMTLIDPSIRSYRMFWARSTKNELEVRGANEWSLDGVSAGGTHRPSRTGLSRFSTRIAPVFGGNGKTGGVSRRGIKRDGVEFYYMDEGGKGFSGEKTIPVPPPGQALHWYHLEMENQFGRKFQTLPIWDEDGSRSKQVNVPVWKEDGTVADFMIEGTRVPFWHYPLDEDYGKIILDVSGYEHHGAVGYAKYGGGHLGYTGYNHLHNGPVSPFDPKKDHSLYRRDRNGRGYLRFNGSNDYVIVQGGTAFPGACTYEVSVRPAELGRVMGIVGTANNQMSIDLLPDGAVRVTRKGAREGAAGMKSAPAADSSVTSSVKVVPGRWTKIAVTYDLKVVRLYVNGKPAGEMPSNPVKDHEWINHVILGSKCGWVWRPHGYFKGDIRGIRIYGRNLAVSEFL